MLFDHPLVMVRGQRRQALGQEVVVGVAGPDFDHVALLAQMIHRLDQQQLDTAVGSLRQSLVRILRRLALRASVFDMRLPVLDCSNFSASRHPLARTACTARMGMPISGGRPTSLIRTEFLLRRWRGGCRLTGFGLAIDRGGLAELRFSYAGDCGGCPPPEPGLPPSICIRSQTTFNFDRFWPSVFPGVLLQPALDQHREPLCPGTRWPPPPCGPT